VRWGGGGGVGYNLVKHLVKKLKYRLQNHFSNNQADLIEFEFPGRTTFSPRPKHRTCGHINL